jgi:acetyl esterase/lipase
MNIPLWSENGPSLEIHVPATPAKVAVVVCPGGGYRVLAPHEAGVIGDFLAAHGVLAAVVPYRVYPHHHPAPFADACRAMRLMRHHFDGLPVGIMGFSAGGHLAATVATQPDLYPDPNDEFVGEHSARPDRVILAYPVISLVVNPHQGLIASLLGENSPDEQRRQLSAELHVTKDTPPAFLFHTADDAVVPVENSLLFASACARHQVPVELHIFPHGRHGVGLAADDPVLRQWPDLLVNWLKA